MGVRILGGVVEGLEGLVDGELTRKGVEIEGVDGLRSRELYG